ncbi:MAG TPA: GNAT family N-acetyltransferase, partial [Fibrobacteraceae bacterium]|nr:GNAT family N-acetyltransferase [Fibrobacteraceae bacterium]
MILKINEHIELKSIQLRDAPEIFNVIDSERETLRRWLPFIDATLTVADTENYIQSIESMPVNSRDLVFLIRYQGDFAGLIGLKSIDFNNKRAEIG